MKKQNYLAPEMTIISVELENGIAQSSAGYGDAGEAGAPGSESGSTDW